MGDLYTASDKLSYVYRIFDPVEKKYCASGHSLYGKGRSIWLNMSSATNAKKHMSDEIRDRLIIRKFQMVEAV